MATPNRAKPERTLWQASPVRTDDWNKPDRNTPAAIAVRLVRVSVSNAIALGHETG
jgi:hypothetical protein